MSSLAGSATLGLRVFFVAVHSAAVCFLVLWCGATQQHGQGLVLCALPELEAMEHARVRRVRHSLQAPASGPSRSSRSMECRPRATPCA